MPTIVDVAVSAEKFNTPSAQGGYSISGLPYKISMASPKLKKR
ncbi:hypothetical protein DCOP10_11962 [Armatimonadetes bacterium DC]|nr:hypothetical protein DCOP10_11962 [Armatimonadetes bacterium DC]